MPRPGDHLLSVLAGLRFRARALFRRRQLDQDLDDELQHHLALRTAAEAPPGDSAEAGRRAALLRFGSVGRIRDEVRDASRFLVLAEFVQDARRGLRSFRRAPVFAVMTVLILSLGIGLNLAIFHVMNGVLFQPVPGLASPDRLVAIGSTQNGAGFDLLSYPNAMSLLTRNTVLSDLAASADLTVSADSDSETVRLHAQLVSGNFFRVMGFAAGQGAAFSDNDDRADAHVAVVSDDFWRRTFGSSVPVAGTTIRVNRVLVQVVGVAPPGFRGLTPDSPVDVWLPLGAATTFRGQPGVVDDPLTNRSATWLSAVGRLKPDVSLRDARASLVTIGQQLAHEFPDENAGRGIAVDRVAGVVGPGARATLLQQWVLLNGLSALILFVVCFNVANMSLVRAVSRGPEMALRISLGAGRLRLIRQVLAEQLVLVLAGACGGGLIAGVASGMLQSIGGGLLPSGTLNFAADWPVVMFGLIVVLVSGGLVSVPPALAAARTQSAEALRTGTGSRMSSPAGLRTALAWLQVALSLTSVVGALLLGRSLQKAVDVDLGFQPAGVLTGYYDLEAAGYAQADGARVHERLLDDVRHAPGVGSAALGQHVPLQGSSLGLPIDVLSDTTDQSRSQLVRLNVITPDFFRTLGTPIRSGREFLIDDRAEAPAVAVVNDACRRQCFDGGDPIGRRIKVFRETMPRQIVGVVGDSKYSQPLEDVRPTIYVPLAQHYSARMGLLVRASSPGAIVRDLTERFRRTDSGLPVYDVHTLEERLALALWQRRVVSAAAGGFGLLSLLVAGLGVYGVVAQTTSQRRPELAVRVALGARPSAILVLVLRQGLTLVATGIVLGVCLALALAGVLRSFLYGIQPLDPVSFGLSILLLSIVAVVASLIPARSAAATNPGQVLRS